MSKSGGLQHLNKNDSFRLVNYTESVDRKNNIETRVLRAANGIAYMQLTLTAGITGSVNVAQIPANLAPGWGAALACGVFLDDDRNSIPAAYISSSGAVWIRTQATTVGKLFITGCWVIKT